MENRDGRAGEDDLYFRIFYVFYQGEQNKAPLFITFNKERQNKYHACSGVFSAIVVAY